MGPWGEWHQVPGTAAIQVRVRRSVPGGNGQLYSWGYQFRSVIPQRLSFEYRVGLVREAPYDRVALGLDPGGVVSGTVVLPTAGPLWIDARLLPGNGPGR